MKHYSLLSQLESQIINLDVLRCVTNGLTTGISEVPPMEAENVMHHLESQMRQIHDSLRHVFNELFDEIRKENNGPKKSRKV